MAFEASTAVTAKKAARILIMGSSVAECSGGL
jgi:hypothetical protein